MLLWDHERSPIHLHDRPGACHWAGHRGSLVSMPGSAL